MNLKQWCQLDEQIYVAESDERFKQYAGLGHSEQVIKQLAELKNASARLFLCTFSEPRGLYLSSIDAIADSSTKELEQKLYSLRNKKIVSKLKFAGLPVNWSSWRQFNSAEKDAKKRKQVFDDLVKKAH